MKNSNNISEKIKSQSFIQHKAVGKRSSGLTNIDETKTSPWGSLVGLFCFILLATTATAQPLPPSIPFGSPVPVGGAVFILLAAMAGLGIKLLMKKRKEE
jgi:hypothetical protein